MRKPNLIPKTYTVIKTLVTIHQVKAYSRNEAVNRVANDHGFVDCIRVKYKTTTKPIGV